MTEWLLVLAGMGLTMGTAIFVAAEFSLVALDRPTVQKAVEPGTPAPLVLTSLRPLSTQLSAAQVGITLTTLILGFLATPSIGVLLGLPQGAGSGRFARRTRGGRPRPGHRDDVLDGVR